MLAGKWVELVKAILPRLSSVAALVHTDHPMSRIYVKAMEAAARTLGLKLQVFDVHDGAGLDNALSIFTKSPPDALILRQARSSVFTGRGSPISLCRAGFRQWGTTGSLSSTAF